MKTKLFSMMALSAALLTSCGGDAPKEAVVAETGAADTLSVDVAASSVNWKGEVAGVYGHNGTVAVKSGSIYVTDSAIVGGEFEIDMKTIVPTDTNYTTEKGHTAADLVGHLSTADFFATDSFPTADFVITSVEGNNVKGTLTVRGVSNEETLVVESFNNVDGTVTASGKLVFNRQTYKVAWVHFMKDMVLSDDITLNIRITAKK